MASTFNTDKKNHLGFHKYFMEKSDKMWSRYRSILLSDKMWSRGKEMMEYVLKRGGRMGTVFQIPPLNSANSISDLDYSNEMKSFGVSVDLLKSRAEDALNAYMHTYRKGDVKSADYSFDPATAHVLEELSEDYTGEIRETSEKLNTLGRMVKKDNSRNMALHLFDKMLLG